MRMSLQRTTRFQLVAFLILAVFGAGLAYSASAVRAALDTSVDTPISVTATPGPGSITVSWEDPGNEGSTLKGYLIHDNGRYATFVRGGTLTATLTDLESGRHSLEVRAQNSAGDWSPPSEPVVVVLDANEDAVIDGPTTRIGNRNSGKCIDVEDFSTTDGTKVQQWSCHSGNNQQFGVWESSVGGFELVARHSGKCLEVRDASLDNGAKLVQSECTGAPNQNFTFPERPDGFRQIVATHSGKCIDVSGVSLDDHATIQQWECRNSHNQDWQFSGGTTVEVPDPGNGLLPPTNVEAISRREGRSIALTWEDPNPSGVVRDYMVHDNGVFIGATERTLMLVSTEPGTSHRFEIRTRNSSAEWSTPATIEIVADPALSDSDLIRCDAIARAPMGEITGAWRFTKFQRGNDACSVTNPSLLDLGGADSLTFREVYGGVEWCIGDRCEAARLGARVHGTVNVGVGPQANGEPGIRIDWRTTCGPDSCAGQDEPRPTVSGCVTVDTDGDSIGDVPAEQGQIIGGEFPVHNDLIDFIWVDENGCYQRDLGHFFDCLDVVWRVGDGFEIVEQTTWNRCQSDGLVADVVIRAI